MHCHQWCLDTILPAGLVLYCSSKDDDDQDVDCADDGGRAASQGPGTGDGDDDNDDDDNDDDNDDDVDDDDDEDGAGDVGQPCLGHVRGPPSTLLDGHWTPMPAEHGH